VEPAVGNWTQNWPRSWQSHLVPNFEECSIGVATNCKFAFKNLMKCSYFNPRRSRLLSPVLVLFLSFFQNSDPRVGDPKPALKKGTRNQKLEVNSKSSSSSLSFKI